MGLIEAYVDWQLEPFYRLIDKLHKVFSEKILEELIKVTPHDSHEYVRIGKVCKNPTNISKFPGDMRDYWKSDRVEQKTDIINDSPHAHALILGTGIYGSRQSMICARSCLAMRFEWRWLGYQPVVRQCVRGINPRQIHGDPGHVYDLKLDLEQAAQRGINNAVEAMK